ncbi:hypothetical protein [Megamonas hypermegale]|uniref:hypothetical protein n=1 Tax=Megamonas hypermegale TaxID=158847 RepID=UPI0026EA9A84|nr:hypothetical protein [Megamonas hypermegale]
MRRFLGLMMFICLLFSGNCFAMQFSQPVQIGAFGQFPNQGFTFYYGTIINSGVYFDENDEEKGYKKGIARMGDGKDALYFHYDLDKDIFKFGDKDIKNTLDRKYFVYNVYKINTDAEIVIYPINPPLMYTFIAKMPNGKFIKYIDTEEITKKYFKYENIEDISYGDLKVQDNILTMRYFRKDKNLHEDEFFEGKIYLKWNDEKQNFDVIIDGKEFIKRLSV